MTNKTFILVAVCLAILAPAVHSFWRLPCAKPVTVQRIDPIVNNGTISGHVHTIMGGSAIHSRVNHEELSNSKCATCTVIEDNSAYWIPSLFYQHENGTMEAVQQSGGMLVYYLQRQSNKNEKLHAFPKGFQMLAGSPSKRANDGSLEARGMSYACLDYANPSAETGAFPQKNCPQGMRTQVFFPSCWDGVNLDSPNHKDHVAYPDGVTNGKCPATHPVRLISIFYEITWSTGKYASSWLDSNGKPYRAQPFVWSFGDNTGFGLHGDFLNGWDVDVLQKAVDDCTHGSGVIEYCQHFSFRSNEAADACLPEYLPVLPEEQVKGQMSNLPNVTPIPVSSFDPCGISPAQGFDNTKAGEPLGTCTGEFTGRLAYTPANGVQGRNLSATPETPTPLPPAIDPLGYLGCYVDANPSRTMEKQLKGNTYTPATCREAVKALNQGYVIFSIQYGGECRASKSYTSYSSQGESDRCTMPCRADPNEWTYCGNGKVNQAYKVDV